MRQQRVLPACVDEFQQRFRLHLPTAVTTFGLRRS
jgi:hypothetical protein